MGAAQGGERGAGAGGSGGSAALRAPGGVLNAGAAHARWRRGPARPPRAPSRRPAAVGRLLRAGGVGGVLTPRPVAVRGKTFFSFKEAFFSYKEIFFSYKEIFFSYKKTFFL